MKKQEKLNYHVIAKYYDYLMGEKKYLVWEELIRDVINEYNIPITKCIDICCGTGNITKILIKIGFSSYGIDNSEEMLNISRTKFQKAEFHLADARIFDLLDNKEFPFAVSFYDSLNYILSDKDMIQVFKSVYRHLSKLGIFLFDMNPQEHITVLQKNKPNVFEDEDFFIVFRSCGKDRIWKLFIDFFVQQEDGNYQHHREEHIEKAYNKEHIIPLLEEAGFEVVEVRSENKVYEDKNEYLSRLYFIARKN